MVTGINHRDTSSPCYFTIIPTTQYNNLDHFSTETPGLATPTSFDLETPAHPNHPLLAQRLQTPSSPVGSMSSFLQIQTAAAHGTSRPRPKPTQNVLHVTSDDSTSSSSSDSSISSTSSSYTGKHADTARCSRCQRTPSIDIRTGKSNMIQYGLNSYYCSRCAAIVGLVNR